MVFVVERYLPGHMPADLLPGLARLEPALEDRKDEPSVVRYLGSTIVLGDEACFCQFEGPSEAAVAEVNRQAGLPFDRIVPAVLVQTNQRSSEMSVSTSISTTARRARSRRLVAFVAMLVVLFAAYAISCLATSGGGQPPQVKTTSESSVLRSLTPSERQYATAIASLNPATLGAAFGTDTPSSAGATPAKLTPEQLRNARLIASMTRPQLAAASRTNPPISGRAR